MNKPTSVPTVIRKPSLWQRFSDWVIRRYPPNPPPKTPEEALKQAAGRVCL